MLGSESLKILKFFAAHKLAVALGTDTPPHSLTCILPQLHREGRGGRNPQVGLCMDTTPWSGLVRRGDHTIKKLKAQGRIYQCVVTTKM